MKSKNLFRLAVASMAFLGMLLNASAQAPSKVSGQVSDENGNPLPGVFVAAEGTTVATSTDGNGEFSFSVPASSKALAFSMLGFEEQTVSLDGRSYYSIILATDALSIEETVVVGYGSIIRKELSSSVASVQGEALTERGSAININQALAGKMAGVVAQTTTGRPNGGVTVRVRGEGSLNASSNPLYVVDGVVDVDPAMINSGDVASIDVLKDAASTAIYGAKGANGVVIITTKTGQPGKGTITFDTKTGVNLITRKLNLMESEDYLEWTKQIWAYEGSPMPQLVNPDERLFNYEKDASGNYVYDDRGYLKATPKYNHDWVEECFHTALVTNNTLSFTQGNEKNQIYASLGYQDVEGILKTTYAKRYSANIKLNSKINDWLDLRASLSASYDDANESDYEGTMTHGAIRQVYQMTPILPVVFPDGTHSISNEYIPTHVAISNPVDMLEKIHRRTYNTYMLFNLGLDFHLTPELTLTVNGSYNTRDIKSNYFVYKGLTGWSDTENQATLSNSHIVRWNNEDYLTYNHKFFDGNLKSSFVLGTSWYYLNSENSEVNAANVSSEVFTYHNLGAATTIRPDASGYDKQTMNSYYFRMNHAWKSKYMLGFSARVDGSSVFGANKKYGFFPSVSGAWDISEEPWFAGAKRAVNRMKLRASWGMVGNAAIGSYKSLAQFSSGTIVFNNQVNAFNVLANLANGDLSWETSRQFDLGLDLSFANNRIQVIADYYIKRSVDLLYDCEVPQTTGYSTSMSNCAELKNSGFEFTLNAHTIDNREFKWDTDFIATYNKTIGVNFNTPEHMIEFLQLRSYEGQEYHTLYACHRIGTWGLHEIDEAAVYGCVPGDAKYLDLNEDGKINDDDEIALGRVTPLVELSLVNTFFWKGFTFSLDLGSQLGFWVFSPGMANFINSSGTTTNTKNIAYVSWTPENLNTRQPSAHNSTFVYNCPDDDYISGRGDFLRVRNISLTYDFKYSVLKKNKFFKNLVAGINVENAYLFTGYRGGFDPEVGWFYRGSDFAAYPHPMTVTGNLKFSF